MINPIMSGNQTAEVETTGVSTRPKKCVTRPLGKRSFTWTLNPEEIKKRLFCLRYNTTRDCYYRLSSNKTDEYRPAIKGWQNGIYGCMNIQRFYSGKRNGQSLAYLTRRRGFSAATVSWWLDFRDSGMVVDDVSVFTYGRTLRHGRLTYDFLSPDSVPSDKSKNCQLDRNKSCNGWRCLLLVVYIEGEVDEIDSTQLFYQDSNDEPEFCPFDVTISLKPYEILKCTCHLSNKLPPLPRTYSEGSRRQFCNTVSNATNQGTSQSLRQPQQNKDGQRKGTNVDQGTLNANPAGSELISIRRHSEQLRLVSEVGSIKHKRRKSVPSKTRGKNKTHPEFRRNSNRVESTDVRIKQTVATFAIDEYSCSSHGNMHPGVGLTQEREQPHNSQTKESLQEEQTHQSSSRCILL